MKLNKRSVCALAMSIIGLTACASPSKPEPVTTVVVIENSLIGKEWRVEDLSYKGTIDDTLMTMNFGADGRVHGKATCNSYNSAYTVNGSTITMGWHDH